MINFFNKLSPAYREPLIFGVIGIANTLLHSVTVISLMEKALTTSIPANIIGFGLANTFSFFANSFFTYKRRPSLILYWRFLLVSLLSLALTVFFAALAQAMGWHYLVGLALLMLLGPVLTFLLHKAYAFGQTP